MTTQAELESLVAAYAFARGQLAELARELREQIEKAKQKRRPALQNASNYLQSAYSRLYAAVELSPELFERPRTQVIQGVRVGYKKGRGGIEIEDPARTIALIRKHLPESADVLIAMKELPVKSALEQLTAAELKRIGCAIVEAGDQIVIKPTDDEIDRWLDAILREISGDMGEDE